ncbi:hypothetical protein [Paenibacillus durus]|uniref:Uncharacterized protein n=1 Tax=Paenibacillus durus TaxID=44251 RepID=A0A089HIS1_PAEDU|nr:hypothetical protein [Paenibacillus durus]AIQ11856.1 hypothetical protein PDUR_07860 [Paenibacillus durus]
MATGLAIGSLTSFAFADEQPDPSAKNPSANVASTVKKKAGIAAAQPAGGGSEQNKDDALAKAADFKNFVNNLNQLTKAEKDKLIAAYDNNDFDLVQELLDKAGIATAQPAVKAQPAKK